MMTSLGDYDAVGLAELIRTGQTSAEEVLDDTIDRIERHNPRLNAIAHRCYDYARSVIAAGLAEGPFHGVPVLQKDMGFGWPNAGIPATNSQILLKDFRPFQETHVTRCLKRSGLVLVGTTIAPESGYAASGENLLFGDVHNPWDLDLVPGGSSAGSGAAVAARFVPVAGASDSGGSTRFPAAFCGVFGLKASRGRVPVGPPVADIGLGNFVEGCISVSVRDSAAYLDVVSITIPGDPYPLPTVSFLEDLSQPIIRLRVGVLVTTSATDTLWGDAVEAVHFSRRLCEEMGHDVEEAVLPFDWMETFEVWDRLLAVRLSNQWRVAAAYAGREPEVDETTAVFRAYAEFGETLSAVQHANDVAAMWMASRRIASLFDEYDVIPTPISPSRTPAIGWASLKTGDRASHMASLGPLLSFTAPANIAGLPAMSVPVFWNKEGLPVGTQFIGRRGAEGTLLRLARALEEVAPWAHRRPDLVEAQA
jgi:Asp-tRNA(Asn)/Glu-tRNA(Gln) amidotransferase A subunit family amidase